MPDLNIKRGDRVRITIPTAGHGIFDSFGAGWGEGIVLDANNWNGCGGPDNWYIELEKDKVHGRNWTTGYGYWKQGQDGGTVELIEKGETK